MTTTANTTTDRETKRPTHVAKVRHGYGKKATYERIGVAWLNENGALYVKLFGTQVVSAFTLYELEDNGAADTAGEDAGV